MCGITCKIQWIDKQGTPTPDNLPAVGYAYCVAHSDWVNGREVRFEQSERYPICEWHRERLNEPGMHHWRFEPLQG